MKRFFKIILSALCFLCFEYTSKSAESLSTPIEQIRKDERFNQKVLKEICTSILSRTQDIVRLKEKLNRDHSQAKYTLWREYAKGEKTDRTRLNKNEKDVVRSKKRSYLKSEIIDNIQAIGLEAVSKGIIELDENKSQGGFGIKVIYNYPDAGVYGYKTNEENVIIENVNPTKIVFGFSVDDIINDILIGKPWNKAIDGYPATVFTE
jgi:hypothetical protein